jgi:hypothetical protein
MKRFMNFSSHTFCVTALSFLSFCSLAMAQQPNLTTALDHSHLEKSKDIIEDFKTTTIMFNENDINGVNKIITAFLNGVRPDSKNEEVNNEDNKEDILTDLLNKLDATDDTVVAKSHILPSFFLSSIVYRSQVDWAVWINGFKISNRNNKKSPPLYVDSISADQVTLIWFPAKLILPDVMEITDKSQDRAKAARLDEKTGSVTFILKPNETFVSGIMSIKEGKVPSISIANNNLSEKSHNNNEAELLPTPQTQSAPGMNMPPGMSMPPGMNGYAGVPGMPGGGAPPAQPIYQGVKNSIGNQLINGATQQ